MLNYWPIAFAYLGGVPSGLLIARAFGVRDVRQHGSGNIGATNVWRVLGAKAAIPVYIADIGKGALAVFIASLYPDDSMSKDSFLVLSAVMVVVGNLFPVFLKFKGGKGVNTSLGTLLVLVPQEMGIGLLVFAVVVILTKYISLGSLAAALTLVLTIVIETIFTSQPIATIYLYLAVVIAVLVIISHRQNIRRLCNHTENRFSWSSKTGKGGARL